MSRANKKLSSDVSPTRVSSSRNPRSLASPKPTLTAAAALSFLKDTRGAVSWTLEELATTLEIPVTAAKQVLTMLQFQGYIKPTRKDSEWITTPSGETVSGSKLPHFTREGMDEALASLETRLKAANKDQKSPYKIIKAVAFGDFMLRRERVQAADVGIALLSRKPRAQMENSASELSAQRAFLKSLRGKTQLLNIQPYREWMGARSHRRLL